MNIIIVIVVLAALGLLGIVTKSIIAVLVGTVGLAVSFLVFCTGTLFGLLGKMFVFVISLAALVATIIFIPALLIVIIPLCCLVLSKHPPTKGGGFQNLDPLKAATGVLKVPFSCFPEIDYSSAPAFSSLIH